MPPNLTDQVFEIRSDLGKVRDELKAELQARGEKLESGLAEFREDFAGFRSRIDLLIDDVPRIRGEFNDFRASIKTYLVVAGWAVGILSTVATGLIGSAIYLAWNASRLHSDVALHSKQIGDLAAVIEKTDQRQRADAAQQGKIIDGLTVAIEKLDERQDRVAIQQSKQLGDLTAAISRLNERMDVVVNGQTERFGALTTAIVKLEERQKPFEALPGLAKSLESGVSILDAHLKDMDVALRMERVLLITDRNRFRNTAGEPDPFRANPRRPADAGGRILELEIGLPWPLSVGASLEPNFLALPGNIRDGIEQAEGIVSKPGRCRVRILFWDAPSRLEFENYLTSNPVVLGLKPGRTP